MTPTEQDKKLREQITPLVIEAIENGTFDGYYGDQIADETWNFLKALITADRKRVALEAEIAQLKSVVAGYEIYSHDATQFYKSIVKALLNKDERFYREYGEHALCQTDIDHLKAQQEEV